MIHGAKILVAEWASLFMLAATLSAPQAAAQTEENNTARLEAHVCEKLSSPASIDVQLSDDAPQFQRLRDRFTARMKKDGIEIAAGAPLVLFLHIQTFRDFTRSDQGGMGELRVGAGGAVSVRSKMWSSSDDSVFGGRKRTGGQLSTDRLHITADLNRRDDGRCIWQGRLIHDLQGGDPDRAAEQFLPVLAGAIGKPVRAQRVDRYGKILPDADP